MKSTIIKRDGLCHVMLHGDIVEGVGLELADVARHLEERNVAFDLSGVKRINSIGCREWAVVLAETFSSHLVEFVRCPVAFIDYCNMVPNMLGSAGRGASVLIKSFEAPYVCKHCRAPRPVMLELSEVITTRQLPERACPKCNTACTPEIESEDYLMFIDRTM